MDSICIWAHIMDDARAQALTLKALVIFKTYAYLRRIGENLKIVKYDEKEWLERKGYSKKILFTGDELKRGHLVQIVKSKGHTEIKPHYHKQTIETYYVLKGNALLFIGDKRFRA